jgi:hypothetical protein
MFGWLAWRISEDTPVKRCRYTASGHRCEADAVAKIQRGRKREQWWHYCADHMFGRRISGRRVWVIRMVAIGDELSGGPS